MSLSYKHWRGCHTLKLADEDVPRSSKLHLELIGGTRSGKSTNLAITLNSMIGEGRIPPEEEVCNAVVIDPMNDLLPYLYAMNPPLKIVVGNILDHRSWAWDMWLDVESPAAAWEFAFNAIPEGQSTDNKFYEDAPRILFGAVLRELVNRRARWTLRQALLLTLAEPYALQLLRSSRDPLVLGTLVLLDPDQGETLANLRSALLTKLHGLLLFASLMEHARRRYSLKRLIKSDVILHLGGDFEFPSIVGAFNYLVVTVLKKLLLGQCESNSRKHYIIVDEFEALNRGKPAAEFMDLFVRGGARGCRLAIVIHSPEQLAQVYGDRQARVVSGQCAAKLIFRVADYEGAEACSKLLGYVHEYEWAHSMSVGPSADPCRIYDVSRGASETYANRPVIHPDEIMDLRLASFEHGIDGFAIVPTVYGTRKWRFSQGPRWLRRHAVPRHPGVLPYERCRRPAAEQGLVGLSASEVESFGLTYIPGPLHP